MVVPASKLNKLKNDLKGHGIDPVFHELKKKGITTTRQTIYNVLNGRNKNHNQEILSELINYRDVLKARTQELVSRI